MAIARSLAMNPDIMFIDEVTDTLDPETVKAVLAAIKDPRTREFPSQILW